MTHTYNLRETIKLTLENKAFDDFTRQSLTNELYTCIYPTLPYDQENCLDAITALKDELEESLPLHAIQMNGENAFSFLPITMAVIATGSESLLEGGSASSIYSEFLIQVQEPDVGYEFIYRGANDTLIEKLKLRKFLLRQ